MDSALFFVLPGVVLLVAVAVIYNIRLKCQHKILSISAQATEKEKHLEDLRVQAEKEALVAEERYRLTAADAVELKVHLEKVREEYNTLNGLLEKEKALNNSLQEKLDTQKASLGEMQKKFTTEFENLAGKILKRNSEEFTLANQKNIGEVLIPLK